MTDPIVADYATWLRSWGASRDTVHARSTIAASRLKEWGVSGFTSDNITTYLADPDFSAWTRATYHAHLTDFCAWLTATERLEVNPMLKVRKPRRPKSQPRPLSEAELARVLAVAEGEVRDWILLALHAGLRAHEIAKIRGEDVSADGVFVMGKGGVPVTLPAHADLHEMRRRYPAQGYWFPGPDRGHIRSQRVSVRVGRLFEKLGLEGAVHRVRHVYGTRMLRLGADIRQVQKLMRHANLDTTAAYTAVDEDALRGVIDRLPSAPPPPSRREAS